MGKHEKPRTTDELEVIELVVGQTYTREEINKALGVSPECTCRIVVPGEHTCEEGEES